MDKKTQKQERPKIMTKKQIPMTPEAEKYLGDHDFLVPFGQSFYLDEIKAFADTLRDGKIEEPDMKLLIGIDEDIPPASKCSKCGHEVPRLKYARINEDGTIRYFKAHTDQRLVQNMRGFAVYNPLNNSFGLFCKRCRGIVLSAAIDAIEELKANGKIPEKKYMGIFADSVASAKRRRMGFQDKVEEASRDMVEDFNLVLIHKNLSKLAAEQAEMRARQFEAIQAAHARGKIDLLAHASKGPRLLKGKVVVKESRAQERNRLLREHTK